MSTWKPERYLYCLYVSLYPSVSVKFIYFCFLTWTKYTCLCGLTLYNDKLTKANKQNISCNEKHFSLGRFQLQNIIINHIFLHLNAAKTTNADIFRMILTYERLAEHICCFCSAAQPHRHVCIRELHSATTVFCLSP